METIETRELGTIDKLDLNIELAENGIIIHQDGIFHSKTLAVHGAVSDKPNRYGHTSTTAKNTRQSEKSSITG